VYGTTSYDHFINKLPPTLYLRMAIMKPSSIGEILLFSIVAICNLPLVISSLQQLGANLTSITFIGDLHADVGCAKQWVEKTALINLTTTPYKWLGDPDHDAIVFLGDYVDKGSASALVLQFVRSLQETFPDNVVTMLGNHDFFLILDTALSFSEKNPHPLGFPFYDYSYSFMHPEEYLESEWTETRADDEELYGSIATALQNVYAQKLQGSVHLCAPNCSTDDQVDIFHSISPFEQNAELGKRAQERLGTWRAEYAQGLFSSGLLKWMTSQPLVAIVGDALVVHGGVSKQVVNYMDALAQQKEISVADAIQTFINEPFHNFFQAQLEKASGPNAIEERLTGDYTLQLILDLVQHRGYFDSINGCNDVKHVIRKVNSDELGINRIVVGHTPSPYVRELCDGKLLASDSSLSRSFRAFGNMYCPLSEERSAQYKSNASCGGKPEDYCDGSISRITRASSSDPWPSTMKRFKFDEIEPMQETPIPASPTDDSKDEL
jgi:hypothetical protein